MTQRLNALEVAKGAMKAMYGLEAYLAKCGLEASLLHLLKLRVSQINGCAYLNPPKNTPSIAARLDGDEFGIVGASPTINSAYKAI